jgi:hypothetical protein
MTAFPLLFPHSAVAALRIVWKSCNPGRDGLVR